MNRITQTSIVIALVALAIWIISRRPKNKSSCSKSQELEYFTAESPPVSGAESANTINHEVVPNVSSTNLGVQDRPINPAPALDSTQSSTSIVVAKPPETLVAYANASTTASVNMSNADAAANASASIYTELNGYDSMFDTKLAPSWTNSKSDNYLDGKVMQQPTVQSVIFKIPNNAKAGDVTTVTSKNKPIDKSLIGLDSNGMSKFSNLVECSQRNYLTAQNFWEYNYKYPIVPPEGSSPLGANYGNVSYLQNPVTGFKIIAANKDGGQPYPVNSFFTT